MYAYSPVANTTMMSPGRLKCPTTLAKLPILPGLIHFSCTIVLCYIYPSTHIHEYDYAHEHKYIYKCISKQ